MPSLHANNDDSTKQFEEVTKDHGPMVCLLLKLRKVVDNQIEEIRMPFKPYTDEPIEIKSEIIAFETAYRLPGLLGTPRQISWARIIRHDFLSELGSKWIEAAGVNVMETAAIYDALRNEWSAKRWIEEIKDHRGEALDHLIALPRILKEEAEKRAKEEAIAAQHKAENTRKSIEQRKLLSLAKAFEKQHNLQELVGGSNKQISFGRRCRYQVLLKAPDGIPAAAGELKAGLWIGRFLKQEEAKPAVDNSSTGSATVNISKTPPTKREDMFLLDWNSIAMSAASKIRRR